MSRASRCADIFYILGHIAASPRRDDRLWQRGADSSAPRTASAYAGAVAAGAGLVDAQRVFMQRVTLTMRVASHSGNSGRLLRRRRSLAPSQIA
jgi:hypothetical protein